MLTFLWEAAHEGITAEAGTAGADGVVVDYAAERVIAAGAWAGILAALVKARLVLRTLRAAHALWPAVGRRADVAGHTGANCVAIDRATVAVEATGRGLARVFRHYWVGIYRRGKSNNY